MGCGSSSQASSAGYVASSAPAPAGGAAVSGDSEAKAGSPEEELVHPDLAPVEAKSPAAKQAASKISAAIHQIHTDRSDEAHIIDILRQLDKDALNQTLLAVDLNKLISSTDDRLLGPDRRKELVTLLASTRLGDLTLVAKARLIIAIYRSIHLEHRYMQQALSDLLTSVSGKNGELTKLKRLIDVCYYSSDLHHVVFDCLPKDLRDKVLAHFSAQAMVTLAESKGKRKPVKLLSDIDDTVFDSLFDHSFPKGTTYPGLVPFYEAVDKGGDGNDLMGDLVFLTARPEGLLSLFRKMSYSKLRKAGIKQSFSMLNGTLGTAIGTNKAMGMKKFENFEEYFPLYPEYRFVFCGDSGQGDILTGQKMLEFIDKHNKAVAASSNESKASAEEKKQQLAAAQSSVLVLIHDIVTGDGISQHKTSAADRKKYAEQGVFLHSSYLSHALSAYQQGMIPRASLLNVVEATRAELFKVKFDDDHLKNARYAEFEEAAKAVTAQFSAEDKKAAPAN